MPQAQGLIDWDHVDPATTFRNGQFDAVDFSHRCLVGFDFSGSSLHNCNFADSDLSHANFERADLYRSKFDGAVLYVTQFSGSNLTRCSFVGSYLYGFRIHDPSNVTYAKFSQFQLEEHRRSSHVVSGPGALRAYAPGERISDIATLSASDYYSNGLKFSFRDFNPREREMQRSQVYNRLRRLYQANAFDEEARHCLYLERYYRTRSRYRYHQFPEELTGSGERTSVFRRHAASLSAYAFEFAAGYGLRPSVVLRNLFGLYALYALLVWMMIRSHSTSGIAYASIIVQADGHVLNGPSQVVTSCLQDLPKILYFCLFSMFSLTFQRFNPFGQLIWVSSVFGMVGLSLLALLVTTIYSVMRSD